jgi:16S rRNA (adenine(1408)-N(1))-methyltransferase
VECIRGKTSVEIDASGLAAGVAGYDDVLIDVGTGDGRYVLHVARTCPTWFALGVDACKENLRKASRKAPPNALYVIANALALPRELGGMASKVAINFPWGSLLTALLDGEPVLLEGLLAIARPGAALEVRLNGGALTAAGYTLESGGARIRQSLHDGGFDVGDLVRLDARELRQYPTSWAKRLAYGRDPRAVCLRAMFGSNTTSGYLPVHRHPFSALRGISCACGKGLRCPDRTSPRIFTLPFWKGPSRKAISMHPAWARFYAGGGWPFM